MSTATDIDGQEATKHSVDLVEERIIKLNCLESISPGLSNSNEDLLSNCSTESAGSSIATSQKKNVVFSSRQGCSQCSKFVNFGCPKCSPSSKGSLQKMLQQSPSIGVARATESPPDQHFKTNQARDKDRCNSNALTARLKFLKDTRTYRPELWEVARSEIQFGKVIGEGDGGSIYLAEWKGIDVAAKMLKFDPARPAADNEDAEQDLCNEIAVLAQLRHPNVIMFLGAVTASWPPVYLCEHMAGGDLERHLVGLRKARKGKGRAPKLHVLQWSVDLTRALCYLHGLDPPVIHRDLKPSNLLLSEDLRLKVGDFGLSRIGCRGRLGAYEMTGKTGSMRYMAPEVFKEMPNYDEKVDVYSAGLVLWFAATGERPFDLIPPEQAAAAAADPLKGVGGGGLRPPLEPVEARLPELARLIGQAWQLDPARRPAAAALAAELEAELRRVAARKGKECALS